MALALHVGVAKGLRGGGGLRNAGHGAQLYGSLEFTTTVVGQLPVVGTGHDTSFLSTHSIKRSRYLIQLSNCPVYRVWLIGPLGVGYSFICEMSKL
jgi:hypothetical protein